ncbi:porin family protein [Hyalangium versicolor]|uniref:porin family protein n=1 Tax=Hyalangium versicolor TaxID=2861190 RepID=UPI001CCC68B7|nr:porin family protein [Hyalangium versicolor]
MKTKILVGAVAALLYGGVALANDKDCPPGSKMNDTQASLDSQAVGDQRQAVIETQPVDESIGGSGQAGMDKSLTVDEKSKVDQGLGGSGTAGQSSSDMLLRCQPVKSGTGGSGSIDQSNLTPDLGSSSIGSGGSGYQTEPLRQPEVTPQPEVAPPSSTTVVVNPEPATGAFTPITESDKNVKKESKANMRGLTVMVGGGVEGYTGALAPEINPGPAYGVTAAIKPSKVFGIELGYSGAVNNLDTAIGGGATSGPDLVRNGGQAALTFGLGAAPVQPYVLGGIGFSDYNFRGAAAGFDDDMVGNVPVGAGLRTHIGDFTADLRANYNFLFDQNFATGVDAGLNENGRYSGTLNIGGTF